MDGITPVAALVKQPDFFGTMSQLLGVKQQQQALQQGAAELQMKQQDARQRQFIANYPFEKHLAPDGTPDLNSLVNDSELRAGAGDSFNSVIQHATEVKQKQYQTMGELTKLRGDQREAFAQMVGGLRNKDGVTHQDLNQAMEDYYAMYGKDTLPVVAAYKSQLDKVPEGKLDGALQSVQMQAVSAGNQLDKGQPTMYNRGSESVNVNPLSPPSQQVGPIKNDIGPGVNLVKDSFDRTSVFNPQKNTVQPIGAGGSGTAGNSSFTQPVAGQADILHQVETARSAGGTTANASRNINDELLRLSSDTKTGPGSSKWQHFFGVIGAPFGGEPAANYQTINAYLDRQAAMSADAMGVPHTNAGLAAAQSASGTTEYSPKVLQEKVKFADAMNSGAIAYRKGLDKTLGTSATPDLTKYQAFRSSWNDNFDPNIFRVEDAQRRGDKAELAGMREKLGKNGMAELKIKSENLRKLESGVIP